MPEFDATVEYRDVPGFPGYKAGSDGSVWTCRRNRSNCWVQLQPGAHFSGYLRTTLRHDGANHSRFIHRLVLEAFAGPAPAGCVARHLNGNQADNRADNLAWGTQAENIADKFAHGTMPLGERHHNSRLRDADIPVIRSLLAAGVKQRDIALRFGVSQATINYINRGIRYARITDKN